MPAIQLAQRGTGILRVFNAAGVLSAADVHVALRLGRLGRESGELVLFAAALTVRAVRSGSVCLALGQMTELGIEGEGSTESGIDLAELPWPDAAQVVAALRVSPLVCGGAAGPLRPLRLVPAVHGGGPLLYLDRYYRQEETIRTVLSARAQTTPEVDPVVVRHEIARVFGPLSAGESAHTDRQRVAAAAAATQWTTVIAGGPGTGKTHTIARIIAVLIAQRQASPTAPALRIALAAPTGKAAARLTESVRDQAAELGLPPLTAATMHRLLGWQPGRGTPFRYHEFNRLPYDLVVVDETSMVSLTMMSRLLAALHPDTRLVLVGDPDQLASVDAGAVLADLVSGPLLRPEQTSARKHVLDEILAAEPTAPTPAQSGQMRTGVVRLTQGRRFGGRIAELASAVRTGDADTALSLLRAGAPELSLVRPEEVRALRGDVATAAQRITTAAEAGDADTALAELTAHRVLCAHRQGPYGVQRWDRLGMEWAAAAGAAPVGGHASSWYPGQPLLVTANDHQARIYNGDTGVVVRGPDDSLRVALPRGADPYLVHPTQLPAVATVFAMTIHRSQGSQFDAVSIVLPEADSALLTRELLYTAITRARSQVRIVGTEESIRAAAARRVLRASGLNRASTADPVEGNAVELAGETAGRRT